MEVVTIEVVTRSLTYGKNRRKGFSEGFQPGTPNYTRRSALGQIYLCQSVNDNNRTSPNLGIEEAQWVFRAFRFTFWPRQQVRGSLWRSNSSTSTGSVHGKLQTLSAWPSETQYLLLALPLNSSGGNCNKLRYYTLTGVPTTRISR